MSAQTTPRDVHPCPNCGTEFEGPRLLCPLCGAPWGASRPAFWFLFRTFSALMMFLLVPAALVTGVIGACLVFAVLMPTRGYSSKNVSEGALGLALLGFWALCIWLMSKLDRSRK